MTIERLLLSTFAPEGLVVFDVRLAPAPPNIEQDKLGDFWGGYTLDFKVMGRAEFDQLAARPERRSAQALELGVSGRRAFTVDFSKHEYCRGKEARDIDGFTVFVYSPLMIACEKVRAICQQMEAYRSIVQSKSRRPRARDFFDIHYLVHNRGIRLGSDEARSTIEAAFRAKRVPLGLIGRISDEREFHRENFAAVRDTVDPSVRLEEFDFYVDFLVGELRPLQPLWEVEPPVG